MGTASERKIRVLSQRKTNGILQTERKKKGGRGPSPEG